MSSPHLVTVTPRQWQVLDELMLDGASDKQIAARLGIGYETARMHIRRIFAAARAAGATVNSRDQLIVAVFRGHIKVKVKR